MPDGLIVAMMGGFLHILNNRSVGKERLGDVNMCFVKFLTGLPTKFAYWSLLSVLKDEEKLLTLVVKCLKKVDKNLSREKQGCSEERLEREARSAMEVVLSSRTSVLTFVGTARRKAWIEGAKEVVEIARRWLPEVIDLTFAAALASNAGPDDQTLLEELWGKSSEESEADPSCKENLENVPVATAHAISKHDELKTSPPSVAVSQPPSSPCVARNA